MSDRTSHDRPSEPRPDHEKAPLSLADSREGSTQPVDGADDESASGSGSGAAASSKESDFPASAGESGGTTTGGFETLLGKLVVRAGLVTKTEVGLCTAELENSDEAGHTLADLLIQRDYVTQHQLRRLRQDFDEKKSVQQAIPGYKIMKKLGAGAMASVYLARQLSLDRLVAIKLLPKKFSDNEKFIERFYKEGRSAAQLNHPNIVGAYDVGRAGAQHYFVMEYVDGSTVHDLVAKKTRITEREAIEVVRQVAKALQHAHNRGFVHRDIKPKNVMITNRGRVKLADLGLARAMSDKEAAKAEAGRAYGTPYYISPEQIRGEVKIGPPADIYGLGATFFHMVTGRVPYEGKNPSAVMHKHLKSPLEPPDHLNPEISAGCAQVIEMMMAKKVEERYHRADDLLEDLDLIAKGEPPHFAHRSLDHAAITDTMTDVVKTSVVTGPAVKIQPSRSSGNSTLMQVAVVIAVASVILNIVLITFSLVAG